MDSYRNSQSKHLLYFSMYNAPLLDFVTTLTKGLKVPYY